MYPPWDAPTSLQAQKTQTWQLKYFLNIPVNEPIDFSYKHTLRFRIMCCNIDQAE
ncbi:MepB family protein [Paenibacillus polymyxa]|uniref:MepB family protein n=1 Tax=Paenibacillus polymyxa TaxID=1406 RepID=UPI003A5D2051